MAHGPGPLLCFQQVPQRRHDANRVHLDVAADDRAAEVRRLAALGAAVVREADGYVVMADPEGNWFCVVGPAAG